MTVRELLTWICLGVIYTVHGCGLLPSGQGRTLNFNVTGFTVPAAMVYSEEAGVTSLVPSISTTEQEARRFVINLIEQSVDDILHQQGRSAGLSYDVITAILQQFDVTVNYTPLKCIKTYNTANGGPGAVTMMMTNCIIVSGTLTNICIAPQDADCDVGAMADKVANYRPVPPLHLVISGTITTTNIIMANWSTQMWQSVLDRVVRRLASGPLASNFQGAFVTFN